jgi:hypothetical protein
MMLLMEVYEAAMGVTKMSSPIEGPEFPIVGNIVPNNEWVISLFL